MVSGQMSIIRGILYMLVQFLGGIFGALLIWVWITISTICGHGLRLEKLSG